MKTFTQPAVGALLLLASNVQGIVYTNESDPYYGMSPPVYPTRKFAPFPSSYLLLYS